MKFDENCSEIDKILQTDSGTLTRGSQQAVPEPLAEAMAGIKPKTRKICDMKNFGWNFGEICENLDFSDFGKFWNP